jgi:hypothetical protein
MVDDEQRLVGTITVDDVIDALAKEQTEDVHKFAGLAALDQPYPSLAFSTVMRKRAGWLCALLRSFAHVYDTGGLRRTHLRGHQNIIKRLLVHASAFNLGVLMRQAFGRGTPRGLQGRQFGPGALEIAFGIWCQPTWHFASASA